MSEIVRTEYIDITPTWVQAMPALIAVLIDGTEAGRKIARQELMDLAKKVDAINAQRRVRP